MTQSHPVVHERHIPSSFRVVSIRQRWALVIILLIAALLRFVNLDMSPPGLHYDEANNGMDALDLIAGELMGGERNPSAPLYFYNNGGREALYVYGTAISVSTFGASPFAVRFVAALAGIFTVLAIYFAGAALFNGPQINAYAQSPPLKLTDRPISATPILAAATVTVLFPLLAFSRLGVREILFLPIQTMAIYCFWRGYDRIKTPIVDPPPAQSLPWHWFVAAGFLMGAGLSTHASGRFLPLLFILFIPFWWYQQRDMAGRFGWHLLAMFIFAVLAAAPYLMLIATDPATFQLNGESAEAATSIVGRVMRLVERLVWQGDSSLRHNLPGRFFLDPIQTTLLLLGLAVSFKRIRELRIQFILLWLVVMLMPSLLVDRDQLFSWLLAAAPPLAIIIGIGGGQLVTWLRRRYPVIPPKPRRNPARRPRRQPLPSDWWISPFVLVTLMLISGLWASFDYFSRYLEHAELADTFAVSDWDLGRFANETDASIALYLATPQEEMATIYFALEGRRARLPIYDGDDGSVPLGQDSEAIVYFLRPDDATARSRLPILFPIGQPDALQNRFIPYFVPPTSPRIPSDVNFTDLAINNELAIVGWDARIIDRALLLVFYWQSLEMPSLDYEVLLQLRTDDEKIVTIQRRNPEAFPMSQWRTGSYVFDQYRIELPASYLDEQMLNLDITLVDPMTGEDVTSPVRLSNILR